MGPTRRRLLYHIFGVCFLNVISQALCQIQKVDERNSLPEAVLYQSFPADVDLPRPNVVSTPYTQDAMTSSFASGSFTPPQVTSVIPSEVDSLRTNRSPSILPRATSYGQQTICNTASSQTKLPGSNSLFPPSAQSLFSSELRPAVSYNTVKISSNLSGPTPYTPPPIKVSTPEVNPTESFIIQQSSSPIVFSSTPSSQSGLSIPALCPEVISPTVFSTGPAPLILPGPINSCLPSLEPSVSFTPKFNPIVPYNSIKSPLPVSAITPALNSKVNPTACLKPIQSPPILSNPIFPTIASVPTILNPNINPVAFSNTVQPPLVLRRPISQVPSVTFAPGLTNLQQFSTIQAPSILPLSNLFTPPSIQIVSTAEASSFIPFEQSDNLCQCQNEYQGSPVEIEIDTEINTDISSNNDVRFPLNIEINLPILTTALPASAGIPDYETPPIAPVVPTYPTLPPIIIQKSKSSSLNTLLLGLLLTSGRGNNNNNCGNCAPTPVPYPIAVPTSNPIVSSCRSRKNKNNNCATASVTT